MLFLITSNSGSSNIYSIDQIKLMGTYWSTLGKHVHILS